MYMYAISNIDSSIIMLTQSTLYW